MDDISSAVEKALNGDKNAFERLYNLTSKGVYFTCRSFVSNESDIKDIMQETYLTAFQKLSTLNGRSKFQAWVNRIAANKCKNFLVKPADLSLENEIEEGFQPEDEQNILPEEYITDTEKRRMIMNIVRNALPPEQYQTIILFYFDEMSISDIAEIMGCPEGTVKFRLHAARTKIKREVLSYEEKNDDRLHSIVGIPFFTRLFRAEAESVRAPYNYSDLSASLENAITDSTAKQGKAGSAINRGGKKMLNSIKGKIIAGCAAAVVAAGGITAAIVLMNNTSEDNNGSPAISVTESASDNDSGTELSSKENVSSNAVSSEAEDENSSRSEIPPESDKASAEDFEYEENDNGITITKYNGKATVVDIPKQIDGKTITRIGDRAFRERYKVTKVTIPDSVTVIGKNAFADCRTLESVSIPDGVTTIERFAFWHCEKLKSIDLPANLERISECSFGETALKSITIPDGVTEIANNAFESCKELESVIIPDSVTKIDFEAFHECKSLKSIDLPKSITVIDKGVFSECGFVDLTIPDGITELGYQAYLYCTQLESVTIPDSVTKIKYKVFMGCENLKNVNIPDSVYYIGEDVFNSCKDIKISYKGKTYDYEHIEELVSEING